MRHSFSTLSDVLDYSSSKYAKRTASDFVDGGQHYTYAGFKEACDRISGVLATFGINASDKIAILSENMPNWGVAFFAITSNGRIAVPMLPEVSPTRSRTYCSIRMPKLSSFPESSCPRSARRHSEGSIS